MHQERLEEQLEFVEAHGWQDADLYPLPSDASNRQYTRLVREGESLLLMDAPPGKEKLPEFVRISNHLLGIGLRAPKVIAADTKRGLALVEDFGADTFTQLLAAGHNEQDLYLQAADVLAHLYRKREKAVAVDAPPYDYSILLEEVGRFLLWFVPAARGHKVTAVEEKLFIDAWRSALAEIAEDRSAFVFRDFHVDNLMVVSGGEGLSTCGLLDFQDALIGSPAYDMVSLLEDARRDVAPQTRGAVLTRYFKACTDVDEARFRDHMTLLGAQRHTKVAGLFVRLSVQDGKHMYLTHLPRVVALLKKSLASPLLAEVRSVFEEILPGGLSIAAVQELVASLESAIPPQPMASVNSLS